MKYLLSVELPTTLSLNLWNHTFRSHQLDLSSVLLQSLKPFSIYCKVFFAFSCSSLGKHNASFVFK